MKPNLTPYEVQALHDLASLFCRRAPGAYKHLETAMEKLRDVGMARVCVHCRSRMSRRRDRICDACNTYRHQTGELPPHRVLESRAS